MELLKPDVLKLNTENKSKSLTCSKCSIIKCLTFTLHFLWVTINYPSALNIVCLTVNLPFGVHLLLGPWITMDVPFLLFSRDTSPLYLLNKSNFWDETEFQLWTLENSSKQMPPCSPDDISDLTACPFPPHIYRYMCLSWIFYSQFFYALNLSLWLKLADSKYILA